MKAPFRQRLDFDSANGQVLDESRRYMLMRPEALMGLFRRLDDTGRRNAFEALAASERAARNFTDTSSFALQCLVCGAGLKGNADAEAHAAATGHQNFAQTGH